MSTMSNKRKPRAPEPEAPDDDSLKGRMINIRVTPEERETINRFVADKAARANVPLTVGGWAKHLILTTVKGGA